MCVCMYVCMYLCRYVRIYVCMHIRMYVCMYVCMYACTYVYMYACMYLCMYVCTQACKHVRVWVCGCMYTYVLYLYAWSTYSWVSHAGLSRFKGLPTAGGCEDVPERLIALVRTIYGTSVWSLLHFTLLPPTTSRWRLHFLKIYAALFYGLIFGSSLWHSKYGP
jgi:hypothetical protein